MEPPLGQHQETLMAAASHISPLEDMLVCGPKQEQRTNNNSKQAGNKLPQPEQPLRCPRCDSTNTKFCYYNNYSLSQPRYFCKSCRRYWTKGGTLRNVPVGGGCRKNKRPSSSFLSKRPNNPHVDPQFSAVGSEANSIPLINSFPMDHGLDQFGGGSHSQKRFDPDHDLSFLGSLGLHGMMGNPSAASPSVSIPGFFDSIRNELFHEGQHHRGSFMDMYQGLDNGARDVPGLYEEMGTGVPKRETMSGLENESRVLWGFPWNGNSEEADYARSSGGSWNGINSTAANWQGLINSSMM